MFPQPRTRIGVLVVSGLVLASTAASAEEPVVVGGSGKPSVTVDYGVLDELGQWPVVPHLLMPGPGPARNGGVQLRMPGQAAPQAEATPEVAPAPEAPPAPAEAAAPSAEIVLTPPAPMAPVAEPEPTTEPEPKVVLKSPAPVKETAPAPAPVKEAAPAPAPAMPEKVLLTPPAVAEPKSPPPPPMLAPKAVAPERQAPALDMPDAPPPPVTLTEPLPTPPPVPKPAPEVVEKQAPPPAKRQAVEETAKLPPASAPLAPGGPLRVAFGSESALLSDKAKVELEDFAKRLKDNPALRIQLLAYASGTQETASKARRLSLSRALVVRSYLIEAGVSSIRIDVRALGNKVEGEPADRVDLVFANGESK